MKKEDGNSSMWHDWFAWYPVQLDPGEFIWLETIERRNELWISGLDPSDMNEKWAYREK